MLTLALRIFDRVRGHMRAVRSRRARILSVRALDSLPESLRRDIGWPDRYVGLAADDEWSVPIEVAWPVVEPAVALRRRSARAVGRPSFRRPAGPVSHPLGWSENLPSAPDRLLSGGVCDSVPIKRSEGDRS